ncbi:MAG: 30S ribosomal protein S16 [Candidatus Saccharimonadales bacterium]
MLTIRLARTGRKKLANYRVVVADSHRAATGKFIAQLGHYNPHTKELVVDEQQTQKFIDNGAQPSSRVARLLSTQKGIKLPEWAKANVVEKQSKPKKEAAEESAEGAVKEEADKAEDAVDQEAKAEEATDKADDATADDKSDDKPEETDKKEAIKEAEEAPKDEPAEEKPAEDKASDKDESAKDK